MSDAVCWSLQEVRQPGRAALRLQLEALRIDGGITVVLGPSGAGKTSLLDLLAGVARPASGRCTGPPRCAWVGADPGLWEGVTVRRHLTLTGADAARVAELLECCALEELAEALPRDLSSGEAERVALARALAAPGLPLVIDEAPAHCEALLARRLWELLVERARDEGRPLVHATHHPDRAMAADRLLCLAAGQLRADAAPLALYHDAPDRERAELLGPVNWALDERWCAAAPRCLRPAALRLEACASSAVSVETHHPGAPLAQTRLRHDDGARTAVWHCPATVLQPGQRVRLVVLALLLLLAACTEADPHGDVSWFHDARALPAAGAQLPPPRGLCATADGGWLVLDGVGRVLRYAADGSCTASWWMPEHSVGRPEGVLEWSDGRVLVADTHYHRIVTFAVDGRELARSGRLGTAPGEFGYPIELCADGAGGLWVAEYGGNDRLQRFAADGTPLAAVGGFGTAPGEFQRPGGMALLEDGLLVVDAFNNRLQRFDHQGRYIGLFGDGVEWRFPYDCAVAPDGDIWVVEHAAARLTRLGPDGVCKARYGQPGSARGCFSTPWAVTVLRDGRVIVADTGNRRLVEVRP